MDVKEVRKLMKNKKSFVLGSNGLHYMTLDSKNNTLKFTTDVPDYKMNKMLERVLELIYEKFHATEFKVNLHVHRGEHHDKDVTITMDKHKKEIPRLVKFIKDTFYGDVNWEIIKRK